MMISLHGSAQERLEAGLEVGTTTTKRPSFRTKTSR